MLKNADKKVYMLMLHRALTKNAIRAGVAPLNMELFVAVMRQTFKIAVLLQQMM